MVARLTPDQKVACSNHVGVTNIFFFFLSITFRPLLAKFSFASYHSSTFQICPVRNIPAAKTLIIVSRLLLLCIVLWFVFKVLHGGRKAWEHLL